VSTERLTEAADEPLLPAAVHLSDEKPCGFAKALLMECARWDASSSLKAESLYLELLASTLQHPALVGLPRPAWLRAAYELIQDCYRENLRIRDIAKVVGVHPTHLTRVFRASFGCTPGDLLRSRRLEKAAALLLEGDSSIVEIALDTGFSDQAQFTKAFRGMYGTTPGSYRRLSSIPPPVRRDVAF
jgi:AraC family transcriptional regulator